MKLEQEKLLQNRNKIFQPQREKGLQVLKNVIGDLERPKHGAKNQRLFDIKVKNTNNTKVQRVTPATLRTNEVASRNASPKQNYIDAELDSAFEDGSETPNMNRSEILENLNDLKRKQRVSNGSLSNKRVSQNSDTVKNFTNLPSIPEKRETLLTDMRDGSYGNIVKDVSSLVTNHEPMHQRSGS